MAERKLEIQIVADTGKFTSSLKRVKESIKEIGNIKLDIDNAWKAFDGLQEIAEKTKEKIAKIFKINTADLDKSIQSIQKELTSLAKRYVELSDIDFDGKMTDEMSAELEENRKRAAELSQQLKVLYNQKAGAENGVIFSTEELQKEEAKLKEIYSTVDSLKAKMEELKQSGNGESDQFTKLNKDLAEAEKQAEDLEKQLRAGYQGARQSLEEYTSSLAKSKQQQDEIIDNIGDLQKQKSQQTGKTILLSMKAALHGIKNVGVAVAKGITAPFKKAFSSIANGLKRIGHAFVNAFVFSAVMSKFKDFKESISNILSKDTGLQNSLASLSDSLYAVITPIVQVLTPALTKLVDVLSVITAKVAQLASSLFGKTIKQTEKEAKALREVAEAQKLTTAGFDELNIVSGSSESQGVATASVSELAETELTGPFAKLQGIIEKLYPVLQKFGEVFARIWTAVQPIIDSVLGAIQNLVDSGLLQTIADLFAKVIEILSPIIVMIVDQLTPVINELLTMILSAVGDILSELGPVIIEIVKELLPVVVSLIQTLMPLIQAVLNVIVKLAKPIGKILSVVGQLFSGILEPLMVMLSPLIDIIVDIIDLIGDVLEPILNTFADILQFVVGLVSGILKVVSIVVSGIMKAVKELFNFIKPIIQGILNFIGKIVNGIIWLINKLIDALNLIHFEIPDWVPLIGGTQFGFNLNHIQEVKMPQLANGGIVTGPTTAMIGEAGPEAVLPLSDTGWMQSLANVLANTLGGREITIQVDGKTLAWTTINNINSITRQTGNMPLVLA